MIVSHRHSRLLSDESGAYKNTLLTSPGDSN